MLPRNAFVVTTIVEVVSLDLLERIMFSIRFLLTIRLDIPLSIRRTPGRIEKRVLVVV